LGETCRETETTDEENKKEVGFAEKRTKEEEKGISVMLEDLLRKRQKNEQYNHKQ
jgi:actin-like ATPase involved in cell morphogenesis